MNANLPTGETMSEGSNIAPEQEPQADIEPAGTTDQVPVDALAMPDDKEQMTPPEVGDEVTYTVTGKVVSLNGTMAVIERTTINGKDVGDHDADNEPSDEAALQAQAAQMDKGLGA